MIGLARGTVRLVPHQAVWRHMFEQEAVSLRRALGDRVLRIEHVGSTAIEGLDAKPLIDIQIAVRALPEARDLIPVLESLGYEYREKSSDDEHIFLAKGPHSRRTHHLALAEPISRYWTESILFRDYLRSHPGVAQEYGRLKRELAARYAQDRGAYTAAKSEFVRHVLGVAGSEPEVQP